MSKSPTTTRTLACVLVAGVAAGSFSATAQPINPVEAGPPLKGWGTSLAWWANITGQWNNVNEFESLMDDVFNVEDGLGLTIVRLNIGAGQRPDLSVGGYMTPGRLMPSYKDGPDEEYDFFADRPQQRVLRESIERGVQYVEANGNSPPWWMTITQDSSGNPNGPNLAPSNYDDYAEYLATVAKWYRDELGVTFNSITPLNEPAATWWDGNGNQEGCNIPQSEHPALLRELRLALDGEGLQEIPVSAPEEWSTQWTLNGLNSYPQDVIDMLSQIATHSYNTQNRAGLNQFAEATGKPLWQSEYGTGAANEFASAMTLARRIIGDFREMPSLEAWVIWQVMSTNHFNHTWACMLANFATVQPGYTFRPQYYTFANFSRFIRPGSRIIPQSDSGSIVAYNPGQQRLVIVALNESTSSRTARFGLAEFSNLPLTAQTYRTSRTENLVELPLTDAPSGTLFVELPRESVTTYVFEGVTSDDLPRTDWDGDGLLTTRDALEYLNDFASNADQTDLNTDGTRDFFDIIDFVGSQEADGVLIDILDQGFIGLSDGDLNETVLGNGGGNSGAYLAEDRLYIQAFANNAENGGVAVPLENVTLNGGSEYLVQVRAGDFNQGWTTGGPFVAGLSSAVPASVDDSPDIASATFSVGVNNGPQPINFADYEFSFAMPNTITNPVLFLKTDGVGSGNQRIAFESVRITRITP